MEALQYIYTSWKNGDSTEKGYMIYSRSEGITEEECSVIKDAMQYLAPKELTLTPTQQEIADLFPYSFSYFILPTGRGCVAQSTYLGKDYSGRYGNYIIYALIFDINDLPCRPAELFAESYIKTSMTQEELDAPSPVPPLPPLHISEFSSVINDDQLTEFLSEKEDEFAQIISMILASQDVGIPFYLNDSRENLVLWSAAVQRILPSRLAKKFMFNTYVGDHESLRSQRAREEGLSFHLIGVRPDANYFNYATESKSNRQIVMDFIGGHMTQGVPSSDYARAMAASIAFDCEEVDSFGEFVDATSFNEINGHLLDAYLYYNLLKNDEFEFTDNNLQAVLSFGSAYCSEADNSDVGSKLLIKYQEGKWTPNPELFTSFWKFVCKYSSFMIFTLYELFTETMFQFAGETSDDFTNLESLLENIKSETPQQYSEYLVYLNSPSCVEQLSMFLSGHTNLFTNFFYVKWILYSYVFPDGLTNNQPISKLLDILLRNIILINNCEKQIIEILFASSENPPLFKDILNIFVSALHNQDQFERLCTKYLEVSKSLEDKQLNRFEQLLLETPEASPIATELCARRIALSKDPEKDFWRFYDVQHSRIVTNASFSIGPMILACINNTNEKNREDIAIDMLKKIDASLINDSEVIKILTDTINNCSIKTLGKMDIAFLQSVCQIRGQIDKSKLEKIAAVSVGENLTANNAQHKRPINLSEELAQTEISLEAFNKSDFEVYVKKYFNEYLILVQAAEDIPLLMKIFYHPQCFRYFIDDYVSAIKKMEKKEPERWKRITSWTCLYLVTAEKNDKAAEDLYKPMVHYLRSLEDNELMDVRRTIAQYIPISRCDSLFDEIHRKERLSEKLSNIFHKK